LACEELSLIPDLKTSFFLVAEMEQERHLEYLEEEEKAANLPLTIVVGEK
jgi:hypothetical protein